MESFEELLEQYMDDVQIENKISSDIDIVDHEEKSSKKRIGDNFLRTISISEFVRNYLGTEHDCSNLKHRGLKSFKNPYVVGIPNEFAIKNPDCIIRNEIIVVIDSYGNPGTYINPELLRDIQNMEEAKIVLDILSSVSVYDLKDVKILYEEFMMIIDTINALEQQYISGCDLLNQLQKKSILREIRKYAKETQIKKREISKTQKDIVDNINFRNKLLKKIEKIVNPKKEMVPILKNEGENK